MQKKVQGEKPAATQQEDFLSSSDSESGKCI
jgi:hypothetical protein